MKWWLLIFSIYVLTLSAIPCCGNDYCCEEESTLVQAAPQQHEHEHQRKPELPCSPFFSCNTCHGVVVPEITKSVPAAIPLAQNIYYDHREPSLPEFPTAIWQPPRFSC